MPTATGTVVSTSQNRFQATFDVDGRNLAFSGTITPAVPMFKVDPATLTYGRDDEVAGTDSYHGTVGNDLELSFDKGPTIAGKLEKAVVPSSNIAGGGPWSMSPPPGPVSLNLSSSRMRA
ncbi:uncharacterized protein PHACADRAFT_263146 [Phanerochaete carnosa HHB-10118-sp]|uniref:Uncharacterized protein n=1 Tax=Phanerochaete carnosa (strain HHB-10118-sp) TaxID=650164 RepID=K5VWF5_PHACS|nr:uncharacterized protein PHACADRAFT_263146 [Phanerochaete carnosa HHB-10118-sp]EKM51150.1 hypothetical protein PHACADRAFT_263146 [Phanerochaete carnosa HHB-10118-sp]